MKVSTSLIWMESSLSQPPSPHQPQTPGWKLGFSLILPLPGCVTWTRYLTSLSLLFLPCNQG